MPGWPPLFSAGFRPFFLASAVWGALSIGAWLPLLTGDIALPTAFDPLSWHIHEMLFGFVMAAVAGFLLTAIPNWTGRAPVAGAPLAVLLALWTLGRFACLVSSNLPGWFALVADLAFAVALEVIAARELVTAGNRRNYPLLAPVLVLAAANLLMHLETLGAPVPPGIGWRLAVTAIVVLISVIGGRIIPNFTRNWLTARGISAVPPSAGVVDRAALGALHAGLVAWTFLPTWWPIGVLLLVAALLNLLRLVGWRGIATVREPLLLILHIGYLWLIVGVALLGLSLLTDVVPAAAATHALTAGAMGTMILAVMTRASLGHTGRALLADKVTNAIFVCVTLAAALRLAAAWWADARMDLLDVSALAWVAAFALFAMQYGPLLLARRT